MALQRRQRARRYIRWQQGGRSWAVCYFFFSSRRRHTRYWRDWSSDVCSSDLAQVLTELTGFAPATLMGQAARLAARQRPFNVVVTNVPGPQSPLYLAGHELIDIFPLVPLAPGQALGIAILSYNGRINFGLLGDYDELSDLDDLTADLDASLRELADAADVKLTPPRSRARAARNGRRRAVEAT